MTNNNRELLANHKFTFKLDTKYDIPKIPEDEEYSVERAVGFGKDILSTHNNAERGSHLKVVGYGNHDRWISVEYYTEDASHKYQNWVIPRWVFRSLNESGINYTTGDRGVNTLTYGKPDNA